MTRVTDPVRARRIARVLISDIVAYAGDEVRMGLEKDDLFERLEPDIERARAYYDQRIDPAMPEADRLFRFALVDILVYANRHITTHIW